MAMKGALPFFSGRRCIGLFLLSTVLGLWLGFGTPSRLDAVHSFSGPILAEGTSASSSNIKPFGQETIHNRPALPAERGMAALADQMAGGEDDLLPVVFVSGATHLISLPLEHLCLSVVPPRAETARYRLLQVYRL